ncbi:MAG: hypothetical protein EBV23_04395 [Flavobacteriia bacterium]|jgi:beta-mannosidase|nr:hypothetical protein [Flavobacteriia bacterium]
MVKIRFLLYVLVFPVTFFAQKSIQLQWEIQHPLDKNWIQLGERGSVQEALLKLKLLPDPYQGTNEDEYQWIEEHVWHFKSRFFLTEAMFNAKEVELIFPCIDTYAKILVNGTEVLEAQNYFHPYQVEIRSQLTLGYNEIEAVFTPPVLYHKAMYEREAFHFPAPNDRAKVKAAPLTRKPQYQFGWDWAPRINTLGFPYPITVEVTESRCIQSCVVNTLSIGDTAELEWIFVKELNAKDHLIRSQRFGWEVKSDAENAQRFRFSMENPVLWYPWEFGSPFLYKDTLIVMDLQGNVLQRYPYSFGIRSVKLVQEADKWGTSFFFEINGKPVFMKGGDMIPPSMYGGVTTDAEWEKWVALMVESNFNMVRIWGGGDYASEAFLNACDRAGIMVWHDAMFACAMYPGSSAFLANVEKELHYQWPRITRHPSVVYINGNNEVDVAWKNWGFQLQYALKSSEQKEIELAYDALFRRLLPEVLAQYSNLPYVHTSPLSNWGKSEYYNHGTQHYWGVWHGSDPMKDFEENIGRFNAEFGFQSFPEFSTLKSFSDSSDWSLSSRVMKHHQKSYVGNGMILKHALELYGKPKDFEEFVYFSQLTQDHAITSAVSGHLLDAPRCMGSLYWQINDCWPAPTWSSIDYGGNWKALHYTLRDVFRNVTAVQSHQNQRLSIVANNLDSVHVKVNYEVYRLVNRTPVLISKQEQELNLSKFESMVLFDGSNSKEPLVVKMRLNDGHEELFLLGPIKTQRARKPMNHSLSVVSIDTLNKTGKLLFENQDFVADVWWYSTTPGVTFDRNFQHCLPGKHEISFTFVEIPTQFKYCYR